MTAMEWVLARKVIAIVRGFSPEPMLGLADALYAGGIDLMEITFDQAKPETWKDTALAIKAIRCHMEGKMLVGAGTVLTQEQLKMAADAGAKYIITPNTNPALIRKVKDMGLVALPGAMTPSEIQAAYEAGADAVKLFPAGNLGPTYVKAVRAPLSHIPLLGVGGITEKNAADFLSAGCCGLGVGGNLVNKEWILAGQWSQITELAAEYRKVAG